MVSLISSPASFCREAYFMAQVKGEGALWDIYSDEYVPPRSYCELACCVTGYDVVKFYTDQRLVVCASAILEIPEENFAHLY